MCDEVHLNLECRWLCRLGLEGAVPGHRTFSKARHGRFQTAEVFRRVFERVVGACISTGLLGGEGFAIDAPMIEADASQALPPQPSLPSAPAGSSGSSRRASPRMPPTGQAASWAG